MPLIAIMRIVISREFNGMNLAGFADAHTRNCQCERKPTCRRN